MTNKEKISAQKLIKSVVKKERSKSFVKQLIITFITVGLFYSITLYLFLISSLDISLNQNLDLNYNSDSFSMSLPAIKEQVIYNKIRLKQIVEMPQYQRKGNSTFCNIATNDTFDDRSPYYLDLKYGHNNFYGYYIDDFHYDMTMVFPTDRYIHMDIASTYDLMLQAARDNKITELNMREAQRMANCGELIYVISKRYNHVTMVYPDLDHKFDNNKGCLCANIGWINGIMYIADKDLFGKRYKSREIKFYMFPRKYQ